MRPGGQTGQWGVLEVGVLWGVGVVLVTEGLGALGLLAPLPVGIAWAGLLGAGLWWRREVGQQPGPHPGGGDIACTHVTWGLLVVMALLTLVTGAFGAPNIWDGLTYHLPRVERWAEQGHLGFWPAVVDRQLWPAPFGGYAALHLRLLTGGDRMAFLPSWLAYIGLILLAVRIVRHLGGSEPQARFAALAMATMPTAVLHASSVQTDLLAAFWVTCVAVLSLEMWQSAAPADGWRRTLLVAGATGLAVVTKGTVLVALLPWLVLYAGGVIRWAGWRGLVRPAWLVLAAVLLLNGPHFVRNLRVFGDPLGDPAVREFLRLAPVAVHTGAANLLANLSLHLGAPWAAWNRWWAESLGWVFAAVLQADPQVLFPYFGGFAINRFRAHEVLTGNPAHLVLGLGVVAWLLFPKTAADTRRGLVVWVIAGIAAIVIHGVLIRWQPYGARLQLPVLVWLAPAIGVALGGRRLGPVVGALLVAASLPSLVGHETRPLLTARSVFATPRAEQFFAERPELRPIVRRAVADLAEAGCDAPGFIGEYDTPEYLFTVTARELHPPLRLQALAPANASAGLGEPVKPAGLCGLVAYGAASGTSMPELIGQLARQWTEGPVTLYLPAGP